MVTLINPTEPQYVLGVEEMDKTHAEFIELVNKLGEASDKPGFISLFLELLKHTQDHFAAENTLMEQTGFPAIGEHMAEHHRVLGELHRFGNKVAAGSIQFAQAYVKEQIPGWFDLHTATMDSALAAHIKAQT